MVEAGLVAAARGRHRRGHDGGVNNSVVTVAPFEIIVSDRCRVFLLFSDGSISGFSPNNQARLIMSTSSFSIFNL
jgi:hypothetical protein